MFDADSSHFNEFQISRTRKKARRSCLYCQRAHKTCGNERPCGQCVSRGMPSECADGHRKPPKYLSDTSTKRARTRRRRGVSSEQQPCQSNKSHELAFAERERQTMSSQSIEEIFEAFIDSSLYNTAKPITEVGGRTFMSPAAKGNEWLNQSCQSGGDWQFAETSPSDSDNSEESTAYQCLGERVRVNPAEKQDFPEDNLHLGFTISSGWSGTFFPNGVDDKP